MFGIDRQLLLMEEFIKNDIYRPEDNKPLLIDADDGVGKKALLVKWIEYHEQKQTSV